MLDLPPVILDGDLAPICVLQVADSFHVSPVLLGGILYVEGGAKGMANKNSNGTYDYGPAQINSSWLEKTERIGIGADELKNDTCKNLWVAGWILRRCLNKFAGSLWHGVGCYHAGLNAKTDAQLERQRKYAIKVHASVSRISIDFNGWITGSRGILK